MYTFSKKERLCNKRLIGEVYVSPERMMVFPLSVHWKTLDEKEFPYRLQVVIVAPKKKLKLAVQRNRAKRLMRECYRKRKQEIEDILEKRRIALALSINYIHNEIISIKELEQRFDKVVEELKERLTSNN